VHRLRVVAERTPPRRERRVDLVRAVAILIVVLGHRMVVVATGEAHGVGGASVLEVLVWGRPITWLFQRWAGPCGWPRCGAAPRPRAGGGAAGAEPGPARRFRRW
jgi:hypothetical protein